MKGVITGFLLCFAARWPLMGQYHVNAEYRVGRVKKTKKTYPITLPTAVLITLGITTGAAAAECPAGTQAIFVETVAVASNSNALSSTNSALTLDETYLFTASGTYEFAPGWLPDAGIADAKCSLRIQGSHNPGPGPKWILGDDLPVPYTNWLEIWVDIAAFDWGDNCEVSTHEYSGLYIGDGSTVEFSVVDDNYTDNRNGNLEVDVYLCDPAIDADNDGVEDSLDACQNTIIPEARVPSATLGINRFALTDADTIFDTTSPSGRGPGRSYTTVDTQGCSCEQIIEVQSLGKGHSKFGCSISAMDDWIGQLNY